MKHISPQERYYQDPEFASLVNYMEAAIHRYQFTPSEMRLAAMLASINYECKYANLSSLLFTRDVRKKITQELDDIMNELPKF